MRIEIESARAVTVDGKHYDLACRIESDPASPVCVMHLGFGPEMPGEPCRLEMALRVPIAGIHGYWTPLRSSHIGNQSSLAWLHHFTTSTATNYPMVIFVDRDLKTRFLLSLTEHAVESAWDIRLSQNDECYFVSFTYPDSGFLPSEQWDRIELYVEQTLGEGGSAFDSISRFMDYCESRHPGVSGAGVPDWARDPVYCTWYAAHATIDAPWVERTAALASQLGFGQFILDDGWQRDVYSRVTTMDALQDWFAHSGTWVASTRKFPDFAEHVALVQSMGFRFILWWDPYGVGRFSEAYRHLADHVSAQDWEPEGRRYLCVQDDLVRRHVVDTAVRLVSDYAVDGFKIDFLYGVDRNICREKSHDHFSPTVSRAMIQTMGEVYEAVRRVKPEFNMMHHGGPVLNSVATSMRGADVPFDADSNLWFLTYMQEFSRSLPLQSDPLLWAKNDSAAEVVRHLISSVFFVPCLSMDLHSLDTAGLDAIRRWIGFYRENAEFFRAAGRSVSTIGPLVTALRAETLSRQIIGVFRPTPIDIGVSPESVILNASGSPKLCLLSEGGGRAGVTVHDDRFTAGSERVITLEKFTELEVPPGGYARVRRAE